MFSKEDVQGFPQTFNRSGQNSSVDSLIKWKKAQLRHLFNSKLMQRLFEAPAERKEGKGQDCPRKEGGARTKAAALEITHSFEEERWKEERRGKEGREGGFHFLRRFPTDRASDRPIWPDVSHSRNWN